jgi:hypothetical protein
LRVVTPITELLAVWKFSGVMKTQRLKSMKIS